jgi:myo-inositol 2-dehydrogenase / D-chiro-inositol 1-dehydrogenase
MNNQQVSGQGTSRRGFIKGSTAAAAVAAGGLVIPHGVHAHQSEVLKVGIVGCGGRGSGAAGQALTADSQAKLVAAGDAFRDRLDGSMNQLGKQYGTKVDVPPDKRFTGFDAYKRVIDSDIDVVILTTPPHFRPMHLKYAIDAGKHVFCEKPMAVDAPGVRSVVETAKLAKQKGLSLISGFCWRYHYPERDTFKRIHDGAIGDVVNVYSTYNTGTLWHHGRQPGWSDMEWQVRNWLYFTWLSGDHLVEQAVHSVDKLGWARKDANPVRAIAHGGRQQRTDPIYGHIWDHFEVVYEYADGTRGFLFTRQQDACANGVQDFIVGTKGQCNIQSGSTYTIKGDTNWKYEGEKNNMYQTEHDELFASIRKGNPINDGERMTHSTMMAIMGRMAAYTGQIITWDQAMNSQEDLTPPHYEFGPLPTPPVAVPGKTKFM